jgi:hypothetical protein
MCTIFCLSIHLLMDTWAASTSWLLWIMLQLTRVCKYLLQILFFNFFVYYSEVELLDHKGISPLFFLFSFYCFYIYLHVYTLLVLSTPLLRNFIFEAPPYFFPVVVLPELMMLQGGCLQKGGASVWPWELSLWHCHKKNFRTYWGRTKFISKAK